MLIRFTGDSDLLQDFGQLTGSFIWDELNAGNKDVYGWLGKPKGPAKQYDNHVYNRSNLINSKNFSWVKDTKFDADIKSNDTEYVANVTTKANSSVVLPSKSHFGVRLQLKDKLTGLTPGKQYTLSFEAKGSDNWKYKNQTVLAVPRLISINVPTKTTDKTAHKPVGVLADKAWRKYKISFTYADCSRSSEAHWGCGLNGALAFGISEQIGLTRIKNIELKPGSSDRWIRKYEKGAVILNMTNVTWFAPLPKPGANCDYYKLNGTIDTAVNNGKKLGPNGVYVPANDALFVIKRGAGCK